MALSFKIKKLLFILTAAIIIPYSLIYAQSTGKSEGKKSYVWMDGQTKIRITIQTDEIAEIGSDNTSGKSAVTKSDPGSNLVQGHGKVKIWKVNKQSIKTDLANGKVPATLGKRFTPVFRDQSGRRRILPGNIMVFMDKSWSREDVESWAELKGLVIIKQLSKFSNSYLIKSAPGIECLNLAGQLKGSEGVVHTSPNWWAEVGVR